MAFERPGESPIDYHQCRYGQSKLLFRGPRRDTSKAYCAFIGSTETYGKYIAAPFPELIETQIGMPCANFGAVNAGIDAFLHDETVLDICGKATFTVIQVMGAHNMSNRFYSVHPRRNDRFLKASNAMRRTFPQVDFTEFAFTRHLLSSLRARSPEKFSILREELKLAWRDGMNRMLGQIDGKVILLWVSEAPPFPADVDGLSSGTLGCDPLLVDQSMIDELRPKVHDYVEVIVPAEVQNQGTQGMLFPPLEAAAAQEMYGPLLHQIVAEKLITALK